GQRIGQAGHEVDKYLGALQGHHGASHHIHTDEEHTETCNDLADMLYFLLLYEHDAGYTYKRKQRCKNSNVKSDKLSCDGGTDVGSHDHSYCLLKCHKS